MLYGTVFGVYDVGVTFLVIHYRVGAVCYLLLVRRVGYVRYVRVVCLCCSGVVFLSVFNLLLFLPLLLVCSVGQFSWFVHVLVTTLFTGCC